MFRIRIGEVFVTDWVSANGSVFVKGGEAMKATAPPFFFKLKAVGRLSENLFRRKKTRTNIMQNMRLKFPFLFCENLRTELKF